MKSVRYHLFTSCSGRREVKTVTVVVAKEGCKMVY